MRIYSNSPGDKNLRKSVNKINAIKYLNLILNLNNLNSKLGDKKKKKNQ